MPTGNICYIDEGGGPAVLLIHGMASNAVGSWSPTIMFLSKNFRVIAPDLPGFGKSDSINADLTPSLISNLLISILDKLGIDNFVVAGNSMGGVPALELALDHTDRVKALILVDAAGNIAVPKRLMSKLKTKNLRKSADSWSRLMSYAVQGRHFIKYRFVRRLAGINQLNEYTERLMTEEIDVIESRDKHEHAETWLRAGNGLLSVSYSSRLEDINIPTLIVWGEKDPFLSLRTGRRFNRSIKGSFLVAIPEAGHVPHLDQPELFNSAVNRFLNGALGIDESHLYC